MFRCKHINLYGSLYNFVYKNLLYLKDIFLAQSALSLKPLNQQNLSYF